MIESALVAKSWWSIALRGLLAIVVGLIALARPGATLAALTLIVGAYFILDGVFALFSGVRNRSGWTIARGVLDLAAGVALFAWPAIGMLTLVFLVATWAIVAGVVDLVGAVRFRDYVRNPWLMGIGGALTVLLGIVALARPMLGAAALSFVFGGYALIFGGLLLGLSFQVRRLGERIEGRRDELPRARGRREGPRPPDRPTLS